MEEFLGLLAIIGYIAVAVIGVGTSLAVWHAADAISLALSTGAV